MANERPRSRLDPERERGLVVRARTDAGAFGELYDHYLPRLYGFVARRVGERGAAEEITASTFQRGLETIRSGTLRNDALGGWLFRVAASAIVDRARRGERDVPPGVRAGDLAEPDSERHEPLVGDEVATAAFAAALDRDELRRGLRRLTEAQRRVVVLRFFDDLNTVELCAALGVSAGTLTVRLERALRALNQAAAGKGTHAA
jgi:RNA polymerase sigma-70 factor (ECF subfamily)